MRTPFITAVLAVAATLVWAVPAPAADITVQIRSNGFAPRTLTINHDDTITWHNSDKTAHQVVANDGSFASPILPPGRSWAFKFSRAGRFDYHDAYTPRFAGRISVKGPPPSMTFALSEPIVTFGTAVTLAGQVSSHNPNETVEIDAQPWGQSSLVQLTVVKTGNDGTFGFSTTPNLYTTYVARWNVVTSSQLVVQVAPKLTLLPYGRHGYLRAQLTAPTSFWHKHVYLQRLSQFGQWVNVAALELGPQSGKIFLPGTYLPRGAASRIRVFLSVNQAGNGLLSSHSGTQTVHRR
jgi:plastocyanin